MKGGSLMLTTKQEKYVQGLVAGLSQRKAYIDAGYSTQGKSDDYIDQQASKLFAHTKVLTRYNELIEEHKSKALWTREQAINDLIWLKEQSKLSIERDDEGYVRQGTSTAFVNTIQELNKLEGLYPSEKQEIELSGGVQFVDDIETD